MKSLIQLFDQKKLSLIVSLPANDIEIARAAVANGADAIKVHINVDHRASGNHYGSATENLPFLKQLVTEFDCPVGIVPGGTIEEVPQKDIEILEELGFSYFSIYAKECPTFLLKSSLEKTVAGDNHFDLASLRYLKDIGVEAFEASIVDGSEYGTPLNSNDLLNYRRIVVESGMPVVIPSQRKIVPEDVTALAQTGIKALMIGAVCTGKTVASVAESVFAFSQEVNEVNKKE